VFLKKYSNKKFSGGSNLMISSNSIEKNGMINDKYTKIYDNVSPHIKIENIPKNTKKIILLMYDPDAINVINKIFLHWFLILKPTETELSENDNIGKKMLNDYKEYGYGGPHPPSGQQHIYHFKIYAVTDDLNIIPNKYYSYNELNNLLKKYENAEFVAKYKAK
jgi:Raf kinase inhibitor-like YbhB/YbcL family protein